MTDKHAPPPTSGFNLGDIYHVLFRHKWKILSIWVIGFAVAAALWVLSPVTYQSQAKLFVRYVLETTLPGMSASGGPNITTPFEEGGVINAEIELINSFDLALQVADAFGPSNILAAVGGGDDRYRAAGVIHRGLTVEAPKSGAVLFVTFEHPDRAIVQPVLDRIIDAYLKKHAEIHQTSAAIDDALTQQTDQWRSLLQATERDLQRAKSELGVLSLEDAKRGYTERMDKIRQDLANAEADLAARQIALLEMTNFMSVRTDTAATNVVSFEPDLVLPPEVISAYTRVSGLISALEKREAQLSLQFMPDSDRVVKVQQQLAEHKKAKEELEAQYPSLTATEINQSGTTETPLFSRTEVFNHMINIKSLQGRIAALRQNLAEISSDISALRDKEGSIWDLERRRNLQEKNYLNLSSSLEKNRIEEALLAGRLLNISIFQAPIPPFTDRSELRKKVGALLAGAIALGLALAFGTEFYLDRSFRRPIEIESRLRVPLFLSIPRIKLSGKGSLLDRVRPRAMITEYSGSGNGGGTDAIAVRTNGQAPAFKDNGGLSSHFETLRDRLILYFEMRNLTHKPKLVAVTSCANGSGVSTVASGLAASLSETGDGNVLLVDMNEVERGAAAHFHKGELKCGLDDALVSEKRDNALVHDKLYVVSESANDDKLPRILHKRFSNLVPKLRASDYDYIIFDMPPVSQISPTPRLARFMDMVFMVVESEKTDRDVVKRATDLLTESKANVGVVLNKNRSYVPKALQQEL